MNLEYLRNNILVIKATIENDILFYFFYIFFIYLFAATFSLPIASVLSLFVAATFEFLQALILISFASSFGALLSFLIARSFLRSMLEKKLKKHVKIFEEGVKSDGVKYLFLMRMTPLVPFFLVNLLFGISKIKLTSYYLITQIGMLPATLLYINAGQQLSQINDIEDIYSFSIVLSFFLIGIFPFFIKYLYLFFKKW